MPFVKGKSGNPGGRPKRMNTAQHLARKYAKESVELLATILNDKTAAYGERRQAAVALLERGFGKPTEFVELTGEDGGPIKTSRIPDTDSWIAELLGSREDQASTLSKPH